MWVENWTPSKIGHKRKKLDFFQWSTFEGVSFFPPDFEFTVDKAFQKILTIPMTPGEKQDCNLSAASPLIGFKSRISGSNR